MRNGKALFRTYDGTHEDEPWVTDGIAAGTTLVNDISSTQIGSDPSGFTVFPLATEPSAQRAAIVPHRSNTRRLAFMILLSA